MEHRHIHPSRLSLAAIDDVIDRGALADWSHLLDSIRSDPAIADAVRRVALHGVEHAEAPDRYSSWLAILRHQASEANAAAV
jgi:hypothetical protein